MSEILIHETMDKSHNNYTEGSRSAIPPSKNVYKTLENLKYCIVTESRSVIGGFLGLESREDSREE